jgi:putative endonuclease
MIRLRTQNVEKATNLPGHLRSGMAGEEQAKGYLTSQGLQLIDRNIRFKGGEIDLVMSDGNNLIFVEVRYRRNQNHGGAAASITRQKQQRLAIAASRYLQTNPQWNRVPCRFDVVAIDGAQINWIRDAFQL